jgi:fucose 4-O-acetylase-like acetyltransferase
MYHRNTNIDILRGIGIILVVIGHNWIVLDQKGLAFKFIYSFHMPLFMFISGIFLKTNKNILDIAISKFDSLLKPYFVVHIFAAGYLYLLIYKNSQNQEVNLLKFLIGTIYATGNTVLWDPLWFLPHIFMAIIFSTFLVKHLPNKTLWIYIVILLISGKICAEYFWQPGSFSISAGNYRSLPGLPWSIDLVFISTAYLLSGFALRTEVLAIQFKYTKLISASITFVFLILLNDKTLDFNNRVYGPFLLSTAQAYLGIYILLNISNALSNIELTAATLKFIGSSSIFILIFHWPIQGFIFLFIIKSGLNTNFASLISMISGIAFPILLLEITKRVKFFKILMLPIVKSASSS